jgi:hypothetical protein
VARKKHYYFVTGLHARCEIGVDRRQYVLLGRPRVAGAVIGQQPNMIFRKAGGLDQQVLDGRRIIAGEGQALDLPRVMAYSDE